ncbi:MAG: YbdD/YjiX family protein [Gallionella sp.]|nr:YbdD/YjiX family protein [Gallionella sp.]
MATRLIRWCTKGRQSAANQGSSGTEELLAGRPIDTVERTLHPLQRCWHAIRELSGDDGYERYLTHQAAAHHDTQPLSRSAWFARQQLQKWTGVKRCC